MTRRDKARKQRYKHEAAMWRDKDAASVREVIRLRQQLDELRQTYDTALEQLVSISSGLIAQCIYQHGDIELEYELSEALLREYELVCEEREGGVTAKLAKKS